MTVANAIRRATLEVARLHRALHVEDRIGDTNGRIDVFDVIAQLGIPLLLRPLEGLLGAYITQPDRGVLVTTRRPLSVQRFTAAHELGHHQLNHSPSLDDESIIRRDPFSNHGGVAIQEVEADAFAASFLLPRWLVHWHCRAQEWSGSDLAKPQIAYQLALRAGVSYSATCWTLARYSLISNAVARQLVAVQPKEIKKALLGGIEPENYYGDVWAVTERDNGLFLEGTPTDIVAVRVREHSGAGYVWSLETIDGVDVLSDRRTNERDDQSDGGTTTRHIIARASDISIEKITLTERRPWKASDVINGLSLSLDLSGAEAEGWSKAERRMRLEVAA